MAERKVGGFAPGDDELLVAVSEAFSQCTVPKGLKKVVAAVRAKEPGWEVETVRARAALAVVQGDPTRAHAAVERAQARIFLRANEASAREAAAADARSETSYTTYDSFDTAEEMHDALSYTEEDTSRMTPSPLPSISPSPAASSAADPNMQTLQPEKEGGHDDTTIAGMAGIPQEIVHVCSEGPRMSTMEELEQMYVEGTITRDSLVQVPAVKEYIAFGEFINVYGLHDHLDELEEAAGLAKDLHASLQGSPQPEQGDDVPLRVVLSPVSGSGSPRLEIDVEHDSLGSRQGSPSPKSVASAALGSVRESRANQVLDQKKAVATVGVEHGGYLTMFHPTGEKKHTRFFWVSPEKGMISWDKKKTAKPRKTEPLVHVEPTATTPSAREWFDKFESGERGEMDNDGLVALYREATGKKLGKKPLEAATKTMNGHGTLDFAAFQTWWADYGGALEKYRELALTVVAGDQELLLVAPDMEAKDMWVRALTNMVTSHELPWTTKASWPSLSADQRAAAESLGFTSGSWSAAIQTEQRLATLTAQDVVQSTSSRADVEADAAHPGTTLTRARVHQLVPSQLEAAEEARMLPLKQELNFLTLHALTKRVEESGISTERLEAAMEAKDSKAACVDLLAQKDREENGITSSVSTEWIDSLYYQFDVARKGCIDGAQWSQMIAALPTWTGRSALPDGKDVKLEVITVHFGDTLPIGLSVASGGIIEDVGEGTPAALAGITASHLVTAVNDSPIAPHLAMSELESLLASRPVVVTFSLKRWVDTVAELADLKKRVQASKSRPHTASSLTLADKTRSAELAIALGRAEEQADRAKSAVDQMHETTDRLRSGRWGVQLLESLGLQIATRENAEGELQRRERPANALDTETRLAAARAAVASMEEEINAAQRLAQKTLAPTSRYLRHLQFGIDIELLSIRNGENINQMNAPATILLSGDCTTLWVVCRDALAVDEASGKELRIEGKSWQIEMSSISAANFGSCGDKSDTDKLNEVKDGVWRALSLTLRTVDEDGPHSDATEFMCRAIGDNDALAAVLGIFTAKGVDVRPRIRAQLHWSSAKMRLHHRAFFGSTGSMPAALAELLKLSSASSPRTDVDASDVAHEFSQPSWSPTKTEGDHAQSASFVAWSPAESNKRLGRAQCRAMLRLQLKNDGKRWNVSDEWIDRYFDRFDLDKSGYIDDDEWEQLIAAAASAKQLTCEQARAMARIHLQETGCTAPVSDELIDQLFADVDTAGTGCINDDEFEQLLKTLETRVQKTDERAIQSPQVKGVLNERERDGHTEYKVRYAGRTKVYDAWVSAKSVDLSLVAKYRSKKEQKKNAVKTTAFSQEPSVVSFYSLAGQESRTQVGHLRAEMARHKKMVQQTAELCKAEISRLQSKLEQQNESHAVSMSSARDTLKRKQESSQAEIAALLTMLETAALEKVATCETLDKWKEEATSSQAALQTLLQDNRSTFLDSIEEMKIESNKAQQVLRTEMSDIQISHQEALQAARQAASDREVELKTELSAHEAGYYAALKRAHDTHKAEAAVSARSARDAQVDLRNRMAQQQELHERSIQRTLAEHESELATLNESHADATSKAAAAHAMQQDAASQKARADRSDLLTELAELKEAQANALRTTSESFAQEKEALLGRHSAEIQSLQQSHSSVLEQKQNEAEALHRTLRGEVQELESARAAAVHQARVELAEHRGAHGAELRILKDSHKQTRVALAAEKQQGIARVKDEMDSHKISHANAMRHAMNSHQEEKEALATEQREMAAAHTHQLLQATHQTKEVETELRAEIEAHASAHAEALRTTSDGHLEELRAAEEAAKQKERELHAEIQQYRESHAEALRTTSDGHLEELKAAEEAAKQKERELHAEIQQYRESHAEALRTTSDGHLGELKAAEEAAKQRERELHAEIQQYRESHAEALRTTSDGHLEELKAAEEAAKQRERELHAEIAEHKAAHAEALRTVSESF
eukprot:COSAG02_NODE_2798_length_8009_cov_65.100759_1_plen_1970_part_00